MGTKDDEYDYLFKGIDVISNGYAFGWIFWREMWTNIANVVVRFQQLFS